MKKKKKNEKTTTKNYYSGGWYEFIITKVHIYTLNNHGTLVGVNQNNRLVDIGINAK
jgi:hypothetical protein